MRGLIDQYVWALGGAPQHVNGSVALAAVGGKEAARPMLELLRQEQVAQALEGGVKEVNRLGIAFCLRMEKHVTDLRQLTKEAAQSEVPGYVDDFFQRQEHVAKGTLQAVGKALKDFLAVLPPKERWFSDVVEAVFQRFSEKAALEVATSHKALMRAAGKDFCEEAKGFAAKAWRLQPLMEKIMALLPKLEAFSASEMPEVAAVVKKLAKQIKGSFNSLSKRSERDAKVLENTLCALVPEEQRN